jgi:hypothetical protein
MSNLAQEFLTILSDPDSSEEQAQHGASALLRRFSTPSPEAQEVLKNLASGLEFEHPVRAGFVAVLCGAFVERGCNPSDLTQPLIKRLTEVMKQSSVFIQACKKELLESGIPEEEQDEHFQEVSESLSQEMKVEARAFASLDLFQRSATTIFSVSSQARKDAVALRDMALQLGDYCHWLAMLLGVLDNEPLIVLEPGTGLGILGKLNGVTDNFQLHVLLMDVFPQKGFIKSRRVSTQIVDVARGTGPQQTQDTVTGYWNMYNWQAVHSNLQLPAPDDRSSSNLWIWGEGKPEDISIFENYRVVLLGPAAYQRGWGSQRTFSHLKASITDIRLLSSREVKDWLQRMVTSKASTI